MRLDATHCTGRGEVFSYIIDFNAFKSKLCLYMHQTLEDVRSANMLFLFRFPVDSVTVSLVNRVARNQSFSSRWHCHDKTQFLLSVLSLKPSTHKTRWAIADLFITYPPSIKHGTANNQRHYLLLPLGHLFFLSFNSASRKAAL